MRTIVIFHLWHGPGHSDFSEESNVWYVRYYEAFFDKIYVVKLIDGQKSEHHFGKVSFVTLSGGNNKLDLLLAPFRLFSFVKRKRAKTLLTYEQVWLWWLGVFIKPILKKKIYLNPITIPSVMYRLTGKSLSVKLPIWFEKQLINLSYRTTNFVFTPSCYGNSVINWLKSETLLEKKLLVVSKIPEAIPTPYFFQNMKQKKVGLVAEGADECIKLIYVGRLHKEKLVDHLIEMMVLLKNSGYRFHLTIIGDGSEMINLQTLAKERNVGEDVEFLSYVPNGLLPQYYLQSDAFVSPLTGSSLREAGLCGLPIIAYKMDWIVDLLIDDKDYLAVPPYDFKEMAAQVLKLATNPALRRELSTNIKALSWSLWSNIEMKKNLEDLYGVVYEGQD